MYRRAVLVCLLAVSTVIASVAASPEVFANNTKAATTAAKPDVFDPGRINRATTAPSKAPASRSARKQEMVTWRSRVSRTFATQNGYETDITAGSVNYQDGSGQWQPIDDTLVASHATGYAFQNKANRYVAMFPSNLASNPVRVSTSAGSVDFALVGGAGGPTASQQTASYALALPSVTLSFQTQADSLKENLVLKDRTAPTSFSYSLRTSGLTARANSAGGIDFLDSTHRLQFSFAAPFMFDASGTPSALSRAVTMRLTDSATGQIVTVTADPAWLQSSARRFPVTIDPTVVWTNTNYYGGQDCFIQNTSPASNFCSSGPYTGGNTDLVGYNGSSVNRALFEFPIQTGYTHIVPNSNILDADLTLTLASSSSTGSVPVGIYPATSSWNDNYTTWNNRDNSTAWATPGGDFGATVLDTENVGPTAGAFKWHGLTQTIQNWVNGTSSNNGFLLKVSNEGTSGLLQFYNQLYGTSGTDPNRPHLRVQWNNWLGHHSDWFHFEGRQLTDRMEVAVNVANGNLVLHQTDLKIKGTGEDEIVDRYYNGLSSDKAHLGNSWILSAGCDVRLDVDDWDGISYHGPDGYAALFRANGSGGWNAPIGLDADLKKNGDGTYTLTFHADSTKMNFQSGGCLQSIVDRNNNTIAMSYSGNLQSITDTQGRVTQFAYTSGVNSNFVTQITDPAGRTSKYAYNTNPDLTSYTDANNQVTQYSYNANDGLSKITDPHGNTIAFSYETGYPYRITQIAYADPSCPAGNCTTAFAYNAGNTVVTDGNGNQTTYYYDYLGRVTQTVDPLAKTPSLTYTADSNVNTYKDGGGATTSLSWDSNNNLTAKTAPTGSQSSVTYGDPAHPNYATTTKDEQGNSISYTYDANGNVTSMTDGLATQNRTTFAYNSNGTRSSMTDALGNITSYSYDVYGNLTGVTHPAPLGGDSKTYDALSRVTKEIDGKGQSTTLTYDALDRLTSLTYADNSTITYTYDADGNMTSVVDNTGTTTFAFDGLNRMTKKTLPNGSTMSYGYDAVGNVVSAVDAGGAVTYAYDAANRLTSLTEPNGLKTNFGYDADYNRTSTAYPNGVTMSETYDSARRLASITAKNAAGTTLTSFTYSYTNPATGQDTALRFSSTDASSNKTSYSYDALNRLTEAKTTNGVGSPVSDYQYVYDGNGNRTSQTVNGSTTTYTYNGANELTATGYSYDSNGNQTSRGDGMAFVYNAKDQTGSITPPSSSAISMTYTGQGQAQRVTAGSSTYAYSILGLSSEGQTFYTRDNAGLLTEERTSSGNYYYLFDGLDSVVGLTDASGNLVATYSYDPYGQVASSTGTVTNPWRFAAAYLDTATGLYKMGARYYDPSLGRWTQQDALESGNLYAYVADNPVNASDPAGTVWTPVRYRYHPSRARPFDYGTFFAASFNVAYGGLKIWRGVRAIAAAVVIAPVPIIGAPCAIALGVYGIYNVGTGAFRVARGIRQFGQLATQRSFDSSLHANQTRFLQGISPRLRRLDDFLGGLP